MNIDNLNESQHHYATLTPDAILDAIESTGKLTNGRLLALNSYENRVYQIGLDDNSFIIAKFYRPGRWSDDAIIEEHTFTQELAAMEIPVVAPIADDNGNTLFKHNAFRFAIYPRRGGHSPDLGIKSQREWLGRFLGRIHLAGSAKPFKHRPTLSIKEFGDDAVEFIAAGHWLPPELEQSYLSISRDVLAMTKQRFAEAGSYPVIRLHGDCHAGNVLWTDDGPHFVDFDDARSGPAVQDLWMMLSGDRQEMLSQFEDIIEGYRQFFPFNENQLALVEPLRTLRILYHASWLARRWDDPAFPASFPWFNTVHYWQDHILALREQLSALQESEYY